MITKLRVAAASVLLFVTPLALFFTLGGDPPTRPVENVSAAPAVPEEPSLPVELAPAYPSATCLNRWLAPIMDLASGSQSGAASGRDAEPVRDFVDQVERRAVQLRHALRSDAAQPTAAQIETVIATLPDPLDSGLVHQFETTVQALRTGVEHDFDAAHGGYFRDRYYVPWEDRSPYPPNAPDPHGCRKVLPGLRSETAAGRTSRARSRSCWWVRRPRPVCAARSC